MTKFKDHFIMLDGTQESLDRAIKKAKELGYEEWESGLTYFTNVKNILFLDDNGDYFLTNDDKEFLIRKGYTELKLQPQPHYVYVSDDSIEDALEEKEKRILLHDLGEQFNERYIVVNSGYEKSYLKGEKNIDFFYYKYIAEIPKEEAEPKIEMSIGEIADKLGIDKSRLLIKE